ncbi:ATP-dependent nuclease subunit B [Thermoanaerobacter italicus Ab9]|uniref:ATP-dependent helicase/deoxyribonuclease subunit B n=2 Tax=Thermoanaerobacter TaxID=1754 RepID=D3T617_THEIA|nr:MULTISPECIES: helicase-exonuclease AddAB subunit AddB [Thermoanaerobacter]ADD01548.1 ATP-dependent nuclease subunit B [Thermoanaerobacter italicus Ab9]MDP9750977.1 ATP-dependent helicase/nuclease subunit B [Thermoanaerobacter pentosaceus]
MSIRFIYGRAGTGKTSFCLNDIKRKLSDGKSHPLILFVPEQFTFEAEKYLLDTIEKDEKIRAQVLSFKTLANRVFTEVGGLTHQHLTSCGRSMLIYKIMEDAQEDLKIYSQASKQQGFIKKISETITELKRFEVSPDKLLEIAETIDYLGLREKLRDISLIYSKFEESLHQNYIDQEDELALLAEKLEYSSQFEGAEFWIDGFTGFTPKQYRVIEKLLKKASRVNVTLCMDTSCNFSEIDTTDLFYTTKKTEDKLLEICQRNNISYEKPVDLNGGTPKRFRESEELSFLEKHFFSYPYKVYPSETKDISLFKAVNVYSEVEETARDIIRLVRDKGLRYSEIVVAARDLNRYHKLVKAIFSQYGIPYFIDLKIEIKNNPIIVFITSLFDIHLKRWSYESVFRYLKTGFANLEIEDISLIENYVLANGIKGDKWKEEAWNYRLDYRFDRLTMEEEEKEIIEKVNEIKEKITIPLQGFYKKFSKSKNVREACGTLYDFLVEMGLPQKIQKLIEKFKEEKEYDTANQYAQVWDIVVDVLDQLVEVIGGEKVTVEQFAKILSIGFDEYQIGTIPPALDEVLVTSVDRMKSHNAKALYIIGVNDGIFPASHFDERILTDEDREILTSHDVELDNDTKTKVFEEQFLVYTALTSTSKFLRISYPIADHEGKSMRPSIIISRLKKIFPKIKQFSNVVEMDTAEENLNRVSTPSPTFNEMITAIKKWDVTDKIHPLWLDVYKWYAKNDRWKPRLTRALEGIYYTNQVEKVPAHKMKKLYGDKLRFSVSRLEKYAACPFAYFVQYGLKARERKIYSFEPPDLGIFMHNILDRFSKALEEEELTWQEVDKEWCDEAVSIIVDDMIQKIPGYILNSSPRYKFLAERLKRILSNAVWIVSEHIKRSSFKPVDHEVAFGDNQKYPPIKIELSNGEEINLIGRIDRIDIFKKEDEAYIRIIDYKSGNKTLDLSDVFYGLELQLLIYLDAILESAIKEGTTLNPAGVFYFKIDYPIIKADKDMSDEDLQKEIFKRLRLEGLVLKDEQIIKEMDKSIEGTSYIIPATINKDGSIGKNTKGATKEQFELLRKHVKKTIQRLTEEMLEGNISISPYKKDKETPCKYCPYSSICQFEKNFKDNDYRVIKTKDVEEIWSMLEQEVKTDGDYVDS